MLTEQQFQNKWDEIKGAMINVWGRLTDDEIESVRGNIYEITEIVQAKYSETKQDIKEKIDRLIESFDNDTDKNIDPDVSSWHRSPVNENDDLGTLP